MEVLSSHFFMNFCRAFFSSSSFGLIWLSFFFSCFLFGGIFRFLLLQVTLIFFPLRIWVKHKTTSDEFFRGSATMQGSVLGLTNEVVLPLSAVLNAARELGNEQCELQIITQASSLGQLPLESSSVDVVITISSIVEFPSNKMLEEISRILKPGGSVLIYKNTQSETGKALSAFERRLLLGGFLETQRLQLKSDSPAEVLQFLGVKAKKSSWKIGSSFPLKKAVKTPLKLQVMNDESDLIDEDSLLTEEDMKRPQLPPIGDCEVGSTRKACKNCICGRAEAEEKVQKLGLTMDQLNNPQSACGNCGLGDAFRCSTCPYKGLPRFKMGEKVSLSQNFLVPDI